MKKLKLTSMIASIVVAYSMIAGISTNAIAHIGMSESEVNKFVNNLNAVELEDSQWLNIKDDFNRVLDYESCYFTNREYYDVDNNAIGNEIRLYCFYEENAIFQITPNSIADSSQIVNMIEKVNKNYEVLQFSDGHIDVSKKDENGQEKGLSASEAKELCILLKDKVDNFYYESECINYYNPIYFDNMLHYWLDEDEVENLRNFISESGTNAEVVSIYDIFYGNVKVVPNEELTIMECYEFARDIYENVGITPYYTVEELGSTSFESAALDLNNFTNGDANDDGGLTLADSVAVLQSIGNPDKYGLSAQGAFNGDVDGHNGITGADALVIQQMELGIL